MLMPVGEFRSASGAPVIEGAVLVERVRTDFEINLTSMSQVVGGQDSDAVVFRATTEGGATLAVKVSRSARVQGLLAAAALASSCAPGIPAPLPAANGRPYTTWQGRTVSLTPWITGRSAYQHGLGAEHWREFGRLLARIHGAPLSGTSREHLPVEDYREPAAAAVRAIDQRIRAAEGISRTDSLDSSADQLIREWRAASGSIALILEHIPSLGAELRAQPAALAASHGDAHLGNVVLDDDATLWLLDWDEVTWAPRERDLMFLKGGVLSDAPVTPEQQGWFFQGYGPAEIDARRLAYYRCSWAAQDLASFAARIFDQPDRSAASEEALGFIRGILSPTGIVRLARSSLQELFRL